MVGAGRWSNDSETSFCSCVADSQLLNKVPHRECILMAGVLSLHHFVVVSLLAKAIQNVLAHNNEWVDGWLVAAATYPIGGRTLIYPSIFFPSPLHYHLLSRGYLCSYRHSWLCDAKEECTTPTLNSRSRWVASQVMPPTYWINYNDPAAANSLATVQLLDYVIVSSHRRPLDRGIKFISNVGYILYSLSCVY